jgi:hypothetical protein
MGVGASPRSIGTSNEEVNMRKLAAAVLTIAVLTVSSSAAMAEPTDRIDVEFRYVMLVHDTTESFVTGNGTWFHAHTQLAFAGLGTFGDDAYLSQASGTALSHTSNADDPAVPPGSGDDGWIKIQQAVGTFDPTAGGPQISCEGWIHLQRFDADYPFPSNSHGDFRWSCDNGWKVTGTVDARWELDPALGFPVYVVYYDGEAR